MADPCAMPDSPVVVRFKGGTLGGEVKVMQKFDFWCGELCVPVYTGNGGQYVGQYVMSPDYKAGFPAPSIQYEEDRYRIERRITDTEWEVRWVRPDNLSKECAALKLELRTTKEELAELAAAKEALDGLKQLKKWFSKQ